ncbi:MAG: CDP-alcohol phosphatidyltransferase family protein [Actinomycetota bacterium]|nr:CDP-alcohol phosphatidyltransferase family protein [Actinomycetota bacterium]
MEMLDGVACPVELDSRAFTDTALAALRADSWSPGAWARFAATVARRSGGQVAAHPHAAVELTVLHGLFLAAARGRGRRWIATSWLMAVTHLGLLGRRRSIGWPNAISLARANLAVTGTPLGRWLGVVAAVSDKLDGALARQQGPTMFGFYADSLADAVFWMWLASRGDPSRPVLAASVAAWAAPVAAMVAASIAEGEMVECPRPALFRPAAAMQVVLAARTLKGFRPM